MSEAKDDLFAQMKMMARARNLDVRWQEARQHFRQRYDALKDHEKRSLRVNFESWLTRQRYNRRERLGA